MIKIINLKKFLFPWISTDISKIKLNSIKLNSKKIIKNDIFIALYGNCNHGKNFIFEAIKNGSSIILIETKNILKHGIIYFIKNIPIIYFYNLNYSLSELSGKFYLHPSRYMNVIGITGTNGKTTISHFIAKWLFLLGEKIGIIGTLGYGCLNKMKKSKNTTNSAIKCQKLLNFFLKKNINTVVMEVSSHGLHQNRVNNINFFSAIFSNLSQDHIDYHKNMMQYEQSKWKLFSKLNVYKYIINYDDVIGKNWIKKIPNSIIVSTKKNSIKKFKNLKMYVKDIFFHYFGTKLSISSSWGSCVINTKIFGEFNINNLLLSFVALLTLGYNFKSLANVAENLTMPNGRMKIFYVKKIPRVIVDYAHTPDALEKVLSAIKLHFKKNIWSIFGCGGDRDKSKRRVMGKICDLYSINIILTNDNPRSESETKIFNDIKIGIKNLNKVNIIPSREHAIKFAIDNSNEKDIVLILGKGHEEHQVFKYKKVFFSDQILVNKILYKT
ncbi:murE [Wigglesworthia glossinidia endosymbiont of Glossina brevipalpis]|uniref:UDP-N-acetylmuramoyl-L-alanyl-D-glutamate--2,6-diaminopimelate ligase n=1 Tax=Wigglesworthia glossinidia brevipalpis TaxID=36870 RepID=MURE_WIGBR|nr:RecName: Full=UDP-N-acetylmuramoyl-L-alanyl-D-glutamate--2,6-diaminopimelate ligase; AltName: Full=Meso-A2pm-adding enzyme; AltName: Full=Meso-diaminopimelate-adding enzyme; AltName: Full=UDP-MurNAc-L-Ala-D-Glu:meso-diaminopimelate ligase; AltName: Full=UDP-MurNAc-tripeptide synthetase; AltName: Full=UDP-N-acetylmuramyl-tripeptide synthetase [Wigglesworthia glossinidia endosymbiont of Glossina brevipalpis]BAC24357.1 murE [Wigglesworthia glossinidia endosymbiont of Glossina brevipalpis]